MSPLLLFRDGYEPELAAVSTGSHIDAIPYSGKYDGVVGVLGAIEAINVLQRCASGLTVANECIPTDMIELSKYYCVMDVLR